MTLFLVTKLLYDSVYRARSYCLGNVDIRPPSSDTKLERAAILQSLSANDETAKIDLAMRISTVVEAESSADAIRLADDKFATPVDLYRSDNAGLAKIILLRSGCVSDLHSLTVDPIEEKKPFRSFPAFIREPDGMPAMDRMQWILGAGTELSTRYLRSIHWSGNAMIETNLQVRILFRWFAVEAMWKSGESDNVAPVILWALGFPNGKGAYVISEDLIRRLQKHKTYSAWHKRLEGTLEAIREFRNKSSHEGFRPLDISRQDLLLFDRVMKLGCPRVQGLAMRAIESDISSLTEAKEMLPALFEYRDLIIEGTHGTVIHILENPAVHDEVT